MPQGKGVEGFHPEPRTPMDWLTGMLEIVAGVSVLRYVPTTISFATILVWALICALISGSLWAFLVRISPKIPILRKSTGFFGGNNKEPNGAESFIFSVVVFAPLTFAAMHLERSASALQSVAPYCGYLVGTAIGAFAFYGGQVRNRILRREYGYIIREVLLAWAWAALLAVPAVIGYETGMALTAGTGSISVQRMLTRAIFIIFGVSLPVSGFVTLIPGDEHEDTRGMLAGGFLVWVSLGALLIKSPSSLFEWLRGLLQ